MYLQSFFTDLQCYMELLLLYKGLTPIGDFSTILITYSLRIFLSGKFIANVRRAFHWCFTCECNTTRASLINGLSDSVDISYEGKFW